MRRSCTIATRHCVPARLWSTSNSSSMPPSRDFSFSFEVAPAPQLPRPAPRGARPSRRARPHWRGQRASRRRPSRRSRRSPGGEPVRVGSRPQCAWHACAAQRDFGPRGLDVDWECVWGGSAPRSVFAEGGGMAGCLGVVLGGRDPQRAGPQPDVLPIRIKPLATEIATESLPLRPEDRLHAVGDTDRPEHARQVRLHGLFADPELTGNQLVGHPFEEETEHFPLSG